ncbi:glycosyltransferase [Candidatus Shapirobacteria bacterium]|nr:glycosyltransferase [Candidatus Shapirobacteria bacterium]
MKTAFVYDKWFSSLGGGEVVAGHLALGLQKLGYQTTIITGLPTSLSQAKKILKLDLSGINIIESFNDQLQINRLTKEADIFINSSFWDYTTSLAKKNYYYCFFPTPIKNNFFKLLLSKLIIPYEKTPNGYIFYNLNPQKTYTINFSQTLSDYSKTKLLQSQPHLVNAKIINKIVNVNHFKNRLDYRFTYSPITNSALLNTSSDVIISHLPFQNKLFSILRSGTFPDLKQRLTQFDKIFVTSEYTQSWVKKYWQQGSALLYPPVTPVTPKPTIKKNSIFSVGRFFVAGHNKKQDIMISAFKQLCDSGLKGWELHLAGGLNQEPASQQYFLQLQKSSINYPIYLHPNKSRSVVEKLFLESKIYWHAAGFGLDKNRYPERFEHFGITPVEAMSAGCIPLVYNGGGLTEVIKQASLNHSMHTFNTLDELVTLTQNLINSSTTFKPKKLFSTTDFYNQLRTYLK